MKIDPMDDGDFHIMIKPVGPRCNLACRYCYYSVKEELLSYEEAIMSHDTLERTISQYLSSQSSSRTEIAWQGGEPTLAGLEFFRRAIDLEKKHLARGRTIANTLQTNGTLIDDDWCLFLKENDFLVGLSVDGPKELNDRYRVHRAGSGTSDRVKRAAGLLRKHGVEFNTLTVVSGSNALHPLRVYRYLRNVIGSRYMQFIPCVEPRSFVSVAPRTWDQSSLPMMGDDKAIPGNGSFVTDWSVDPNDYGRFLCSIYDEWSRNDIDRVFVINFESALASCLGMAAASCDSAVTCGRALVVERNGDVYSCDHYVHPCYRLGNVNETSLGDMVRSPRQKEFGASKRTALTRYCQECDVLFACGGDCPRNRFLLSPDKEPGLSYLCSGLRHFYRHFDSRLEHLLGKLSPESPARRSAPLGRKRRSAPSATITKPLNERML